MNQIFVLEAKIFKDYINVETDNKLFCMNIWQDKSLLSALNDITEEQESNLVFVNFSALRPWNYAKAREDLKSICVEHYEWGIFERSSNPSCRDLRNRINNFYFPLLGKQKRNSVETDQFPCLVSDIVQIFKDHQLKLRGSPESLRVALSIKCFSDNNEAKIISAKNHIYFTELKQSDRKEYISSIVNNNAIMEGFFIMYAYDAFCANVDKFPFFVVYDYNTYIKSRDRSEYVIVSYNKTQNPELLPELLKLSLSHAPFTLDVYETLTIEGFSPMHIRKNSEQSFRLPCSIKDIVKIYKQTIDATLVDYLLTPALCMLKGENVLVTASSNSIVLYNLNE